MSSVSHNNIYIYFEYIFLSSFIFTVILLVMVLQKIILVYLEFKYYPKRPSSFIFPNISFTDTNKGIPELIMYLTNNGFSLFGLEVENCLNK